MEATGRGDILDALKERGILKVSQIMAEGVLKTSF